MIVCFSRIGPLGEVVRIEVDLRNGLPGTDLIGLAGHEVRESRERVRAAIRNSGFDYPRQRVLISLAPAAVIKRGAGFDLAIAVALLQATGQIELSEDVLVIGELSLRGRVSPVPAVLSAIVAAKEQGITSVLVARGSGDEARSVATKLVQIEHLRDLLYHHPTEYEFETAAKNKGSAVANLSFDDIRGQTLLKRACTIAAAGGHNIMIAGPPGSGKTMAARRLVTLLPDLSEREAIDVARVFSIRGISREEGILSNRPPLRMPHHSATVEGLLGGGRDLAPGEISLANHGVLVLDEASEFRPQLLQSLREPVETGVLRMVRAGMNADFPAAFQLVLTGNLCPCGKLGMPGEDCMCSLQEVARYWKRIGAALLDRIELRVRTEYTGSSDEPDTTGISTHTAMKAQIRDARELQASRYMERAYRLNAAVPEQDSASLIDKKSLRTLVGRLLSKRGLSDRAGHAVTTLARTIADLESREEITEEDLLEAFGFRATGSFDFVGRGTDSFVY